MAKLAATLVALLLTLGGLTMLSAPADAGKKPSSPPTICFWMIDGRHCFVQVCARPTLDRKGPACFYVPVGRPY